MHKFRVSYSAQQLKYSASQKKGNPSIDYALQKTVMIDQKKFTGVQNAV